MEYNMKPMMAANIDALIGHSQESSWVAKMSGDLWAVTTTRMSEWNLRNQDGCK